MLGTLVNFGAIIIGSVIGLVFHKAIKEKISDTIMKGLGLCIILIGIQGALKGEDTLVVIASMAIGAYLGEWIDIELRLNQLGNYVESKFAKEKNGTFSQGFVTASLLFAVGAMAIVGSLESGLHNDNSILYTKSMLDFISSMIFAGSLGVGVLFSSFVILIYQGSITLLSSFVAPFLTTTVITNMSCVGSIVIIGLGLNMVKATKIKVANLIPAIFLPILFQFFR